MGADKQVWPDHLMIRDTGLHDDAGGLGQRIFTTAGAGYKKVKYIRADIAERDAALRAADNRDAAGVCDACGGAGMVGHYAPDGPFGEDCPACAPAAVPAGEAVADDEVAADNAKAADSACLLAIANGYAWDGAAWVKPPTPPAPVQAAPQEGEAVAVECGGCAPPVLVAPKDADRKLAEEGLWLFERNGDAGDKLYVGAIRRLLAAHPSACELGAVREAAELARELLEAGMLTHNGTSRITVHATRAKAVLTRITEALQHRGDSRGGEG